MNEDRVNYIARRIGKIPNITRNLNEITMSEVFAEIFKEELRYDTSDGAFYYYDGEHWVEDYRRIHVQIMAKDFVKALFVYADTITLNTLRDKFRIFCKRYYHKLNRDTLISDAKTELTEWEESNNE